MREIKFRAWDAENGKMYTPTHEAYKGNLFELLVSFSGDLAAHTMEGMEHESLWPNRFQLMQYTGLKDKNGKEVYESDLVVWDSQKEPIEVVWSDDKQGWWPHINVTTEVVGNKYEN